MTHGPESVAEEFQSDKDVISQMKCFQYIDDNGYVFDVSIPLFPLETGAWQIQDEFN